MSELKKKAVALGVALAIVATPSCAYAYFNRMKQLGENIVCSKECKTEHRKLSPAPTVGLEDKIEIKVHQGESVLESAFTSNYYVVVTNRDVHFASGCNRNSVVLTSLRKCDEYMIKLEKYGISEVKKAIIDPSNDTGYLLADSGEIVIFTLFDSDGKLAIRNNFKGRAVAIEATGGSLVSILGKDGKVIGAMKSTYIPNDDAFSHRIIDYEDEKQK